MKIETGVTGISVLLEYQHSPIISICAPSRGLRPSCCPFVSMKGLKGCDRIWKSEICQSPFVV
jgi:hypothetical protein